MKRSTFLIALGSPFFAHAVDEAPPTAEELMRLVRLSYALQEGKLTGKLRDDKTGNEDPFVLTMTQQIIRFLFDNPKQILNLDLSVAPPILREVKPGGAIEVDESMYSQKVRGFELNYEDLALRFLYWPNPQSQGDERLGIGNDCWKVRVISPDATSPYGTVDIWIHKESGGMSQMIGYDREGKRVRQYKIASVQKIEVKEGEKTRKIHIPKSMRIDSFNPATGKTLGTTYMEFDKPAK